MVKAVILEQRKEKSMDTSQLLRALFAEPVALVMALVAGACAITALSFRRIRVRERLSSAVLAFISGMAAWMMATRWEWPR